MTQKQIDAFRKKIADVKRRLAAEKRKFGCYDDGRGLRYLPTKYFIQLGDYAGGLNYTKWFHKQFPDDSGFPEFIFEWTLILFKNGKFKEAEKKTFETFCSNTYLFDKFFGKPIIALDKWEGSNLEGTAYTDWLSYSCKDAELADFAEWLENLILTQEFQNRSNHYIDLQKKLKTEDDSEIRYYLIMQIRQLLV